MAESNQSIAAPFSAAHPKDPILASERYLHNDMLRGTITMPIYLQTNDAYAGNNTEQAKICTIPFYLEENFSFSLGNEWQPLVDMSIFNEFNRLINLGQVAFDNGATQISLASSQMNLATWVGSEQPEFDIKTTFVCTQRSYNPINIITALSEAALPRRLTESKNKSVDKVVKTGASAAANSIKAVGSLGNAIGIENAKENSDKLASKVENMIKQTGLLAPLYYAPKFGDDGRVENNPNFTLSLQIGSWFHATNLIVTKISNISFSKEVVAPPTNFSKGNHIFSHTPSVQSWGFPLYASCNIRLKPITYITAEEFNAYFIPNPATKTNTTMISNGGTITT